ncbi:hypothetical protein K474DRAFT_1712510 [Panus rudis PR-1116 ss-1]|nr:hypothetical protein K474DRAFT_1712510 [Panus rudis PR-1116 ss-1]
MPGATRLFTKTCRVWGDFRSHKDKMSGSEKLPRVVRAELYHTACAWLDANPKSNGKPDYHGVVKQFQGIKYFTLWDRYNGKHKAPHEAHGGQMLLGVEGEQALCNWMAHDAEKGRPWTRMQMKVPVKKLSGRHTSSDAWLDSFKE